MWEKQEITCRHWHTLNKHEKIVEKLKHDKIFHQSHFLYLLYEITQYSLSTKQAFSRFSDSRQVIMQNEIKRSTQHRCKLMVWSFRTKSLREIWWLGHSEQLRAGVNVDGTIMMHWLGLVHGVGTCSRNLSSFRSSTLLLPDTSLHHGICLLLVLPFLPLQPRQRSSVSVQLNVAYLCNQPKNMVSTNVSNFHKIHSRSLS